MTMPVLSVQYGKGASVRRMLLSGKARGILTSPCICKLQAHSRATTLLLVIYAALLLELLLVEPLYVPLKTLARM